MDDLCCALFPASCRLCGDPLTQFSRLPVCHSCWNQLPQQYGNLCAVCGEALGAQGLDSSARDLLCRLCRMEQPAFVKAVAHGLYQGRLRELIHLLKYEGMRPVAERLGALIALQVMLLENLPQQMTVVPVPLFAAKRRQRRFNQAELLAHSAVRVLKQQRSDVHWTVAAGLLERRRATESQAGLTPHQRRANVRGAFFVAQPEKVKEKDVLLLDDIYTTGATARACAQTLRRAGARSVWVATVARAQRQEMVEVPMQQDVAFWSSGFVPAARSA